MKIKSDDEILSPHAQHSLTRTVFSGSADEHHWKCNTIPHPSRSYWTIRSSRTVRRRSDTTATYPHTIGTRPAWIYGIVAISLISNGCYWLPYNSSINFVKMNIVLCPAVCLPPPISVPDSCCIWWWPEMGTPWLVLPSHSRWWWWATQTIWAKRAK